MRALLLALCSCASLSLQYGEPSPHDEQCGQAGSVTVRSRPGVFLDCAQAVSLTREALSFEPVETPWVVIFSNEPAGADIGGDLKWHFFGGMTYPTTRVIAVQGQDLLVLIHELGHAHDIERGLANARDL